MLIILMALSPIGFAGDFIPALKSKAEEWRSNLFDQIMVAPVFIFFMIIVMKMMGASGNLIRLTETATSADSAIQGSPLGVLLNYVLVIGMLVASVKITKKLSGSIGESMGKLAGSIGGLAIGLATGGAAGLGALAGRATIGRMAASAASSERLANMAKKGGLAGMAGRMALKTADNTSKASFDLRNTKSFKGLTDNISSQTGLKINSDVGLKVQKDGYQGMVKRQSEDSEKVAKMIHSADANVGDPEVMAEVDVAANRRSEITALQRKSTRTAQEQQRLEELNEEHEKYNQRFKGIDEANDKVEFVRSVIEKEKKAARVAKYAEQEERSKLNKLYRNKRDTKTVAKKIRETAKDKSGKALIEEALKKINEEEASKTPNATGTPPPGGNTPPGGTPPPSNNPNP